MVSKIIGPKKNWRISIYGDADTANETENLAPHLTVESSEPPKIWASCVVDGVRYLYTYDKPELRSKEKFKV